MSSLANLGEIVDTDVLVVGGGLAGLRAGIAARDIVEKVTLVEKGFAGKAGHAKLALGMSAVVLPEDDLGICVQDLLRAQDLLIDPKVAEYLLRTSYERLKELQSWGIEFLRTGNQYQTTLARGAHTLKNVVPESGGEDFLRGLTRQVLHKGVDVRNRTYVTDLLTRNGRVVGAVGMQTRTGEFVIFRAKATILATNTVGYRGHYPMADMVGDGPAMAYQAGADVVNCEFNIVNTGPLKSPFAGTGPSAFFGAKLRNSLGEAFMDKHEPELGDRADLGAIAQATALELKMGHAPLFFDFTNMDKEACEKWRSGARFNWESVHHKRLHKYGLDVDKREWMPVFMYSVGALKTSFDGQSNLAGLFAAGKARSCGISLLTGWSFCVAIGTGFQSGQSAGEYAKHAGTDVAPDVAQVESLRDELYRPLKRSDGISPDEVTRRVQETVFPYDVTILKHPDRLKTALQIVERIRGEDLPRTKAGDAHELVKARETQDIVLNAELMLRASLARTESRPGHFREDYPARDDANWLKWIVLRREANGTGMRFVPLA